MNLILGTANFDREGYGKKLEKDECFKLLDRAKELRIETVATAFDYGIDIVGDYGWKNVIHKRRDGEIFWEGNGISGLTLDSNLKADVALDSGILMAPLNPLNLSFLPWANHHRFIARSIFCGGRLQRSHPEDIARLVFGFLKSHDVKNACFGVESIEELELIVEIARQ